MWLPVTRAGRRAVLSTLCMVIGTKTTTTWPAALQPRNTAAIYDSEATVNRFAAYLAATEEIEKKKRILNHAISSLRRTKVKRYVGIYWTICRIEKHRFVKIELQHTASTPVKKNLDALNGTRNASDTTRPRKYSVCVPCASRNQLRLPGKLPEYHDRIAQQRLEVML